MWIVSCCWAIVWLPVKFRALCFRLSGSLSAMRFVTAVQEREKDGDKQVEQVSRELWRRIWSQDIDITEPASLAEVPFDPSSVRWDWLLPTRDPQRMNRVDNWWMDVTCRLSFLAGSEESRSV